MHSTDFPRAFKRWKGKEERWTADPQRGIVNRLLCQGRLRGVCMGKKETKKTILGFVMDFSEYESERTGQKKNKARPGKSYLAPTPLGAIVNLF